MMLHTYSKKSETDQTHRFWVTHTVTYGQTGGMWYCDNPHLNRNIPSENFNRGKNVIIQTPNSITLKYDVPGVQYIYPGDWIPAIVTVDTTHDKISVDFKL